MALCSRGGCYASAEKHCGGLCGYHFAGLSDERKRGIREAAGQPIPPSETHVHQHTHINPPLPRWLTALIGFAGGLAGSAAWAAVRWWLKW